MGINLRRNAALWAAGTLLAANAVSSMASNPSTVTNHVVATGGHESGPPLAHTGGFGEPTCQVCHSEFDVNPSRGALGVDGLPPQYEPGRRYTLSLSVLGDEMQYAGFQAAARFLDGPNRGSSAGSFEPTDREVTVRRDPASGVDYLQHTRSGSRAVLNGIATWTAVWIAPRDTARVVFHVAANDANGDNSPLGDFVYTTDVVSSGTASDIRESQKPR